MARSAVFADLLGDLAGPVTKKDGEKIVLAGPRPRYAAPSRNFALSAISAAIAALMLPMGIERTLLFERMAYRTTSSPSTPAVNPRKPMPCSADRAQARRRRADR